MASQLLRAAEGAGVRTAARPAGVGGRALRGLTRASDGAALWMAAAAVLAVAGGERGRRAAVRATAALAVSSALVNGPAKLLVRRRRPGRWTTAGLRRSGREPRTSSFPSGHTASAFAFATAAGLEVPALGPALGGTAVLVGWSRLHGAQHFPTDVVAGAALGTAVGLLTSRRWPSRPVEAGAGPGAGGEPVGRAEGEPRQANLVAPVS